ncbi:MULTISPECIES: hypothetical protein [Pseudanabaena]|uniref:hypothetical protein n=1 Tax=Pseudanabaena TaxID=1152 RepID=UPI00247AAD41|nr:MULTISPECIES: hypothetical protein [Pseudanabaena]MEA5485321.1 hypothetical protein [Pseudanabaena sp. CCNP1317]WGS72550.1 hypothetical protein OA858_00575 [Pseudanabaena galeata CCNP1313]
MSGGALRRHSSFRFKNEWCGASRRTTHSCGRKDAIATAFGLLRDSRQRVSTKQKLPKLCDRDSLWPTLRLAPASIDKTKAAEIMRSRQLL